MAREDTESGEMAGVVHMRLVSDLCLVFLLWSVFEGGGSVLFLRSTRNWSCFSAMCVCFTHSVCFTVFLRFSLKEEECVVGVCKHNTALVLVYSHVCR